MLSSRLSDYQGEFSALLSRRTWACAAPQSIRTLRRNLVSVALLSMAAGTTVWAQSGPVKNVVCTRCLG